MKKRFLGVALVLLASSLSACGRPYTGNYRGAIQMDVTGLEVRFDPVTLIKDMQLSQNGNGISGSFNGTLFNGTLNGIVNGDQITGVNLVMTSVSSSGGLTSGQSCTYTGTLTASGGWPAVNIAGDLTLASGLPMVCASKASVNNLAKVN